MLLVLIMTFGVIFLLCSVYLKSRPTMCTSTISMKGKVVIVTGANSGIGFHTAKELAKRGARVMLACRSEARGSAARDQIVALTGNEDVEFKKLDLSSLESVRRFATDIANTERRLDVLVNNAGVYGCNDYTSDGIIEGLQVNYFGHFLLTLLLLPLLKKSQPSRIINLSSILHFFGNFDHETINRMRLFNSLLNYCNSKFCMLMFSLELARRLQGTGVVANAVHPGVIMTDITKYGTTVVQWVFWWCCLVANRTVEEGAQTIIHLAVADECANVSGKYYVDCSSRFMSWRAKNERTAKELWDYSTKLVS